MIPGCDCGACELDRVSQRLAEALKVHADWLADAKERGRRGAGIHAGMKKEQRADGVTT